MSYVFVSYSRQNTELMLKITSDLRAKGVNIWVDQTGLKPGESDWRERIEHIIEEAACLVVLLSPEAKDSEWVNNELQYAETFGRPIYPLLIIGDARNAVPINLIRAQRIDFQVNYEQKIDELVSILAQYADTISEKDFLSRVFMNANSPQVLFSLLKVLSPEERCRLEDRLLVIKALIEGKSDREIESELGAGASMVSSGKRLCNDHEWLTDVQDLLREIPDQKL